MYVLGSFKLISIYFLRILFQVGYLLGLIKNLKSQRSKPCKLTYGLFFLLCTCKPAIFMNEYVTNALVGIVRRDVNSGLKSINKSNSHLHQMILNLLTQAFSEVTNWPEIFLKVSNMSLIFSATFICYDFSYMLKMQLEIEYLLIIPCANHLLTI